MSTVNVNTEAIDAFLGKVRGLENVDFTPLMNLWREFLEEDNKEGALAGLDGFGNPLQPVTYRPDPDFTGVVNTGIRANDNLWPSYYRTLDGPPLAPQGLESRIVTHYRTAWEHPAPGEWLALGAWEDVVSISGVPFLQAHFTGLNNLPVRDLAHVRPTALQRARDALQGFATALMKRIKG